MWLSHERQAVRKEETSIMRDEECNYNVYIEEICSYAYCRGKEHLKDTESREKSYADECLLCQQYGIITKQ